MSANLALRDCYAEVPRSTRRATIAGAAAIVLFVFVFGYWGTFAPLAGAVVTTGTFVTSGENKVIQHLEGGVIRQILVHEGDVVEPGQVLVKLDDTAAKAQLQRLVLRQAQLAATEIRLHAEMREAHDLQFPAAMLDQARTDDDLRSVLTNEMFAFKAHRAEQDSRIASLQRGVAGLRDKLSGSRAQLQAVRSQIAIFEEEYKSKKVLAAQSLLRKSELLAVERAKVGLDGDAGQLTGDIGDAEERIARSQEEVSGIRNAAIKAAVNQLQSAASELVDVRERIRAAQDVLNRIDIVAPVKGVVVRLRYHTAGGVIEPGKDIMEIVPLKEGLIIEVHVRPQDIEHVKRGQSAEVRLSALPARITPMVSGTVTYVSADALPDDKRGVLGTDAYVARVALDMEEASRVHDFHPVAGMPAEVFIRTRERTFLDYLLRPVRDSLGRAFRES